jgi:DNA repair exonuclease SbcCD ATPase subunit
LSEVRQLRLVLQATTVSAQKVQVTLFHLQIQVLAIARGSQRLDDIRSKIIEAEFGRKRATGLVETLQELQSHTEDPKLREARDEDLRRQKRELEMREAEVQQLRTIESEALVQLQVEQTKQAELEERLDKLEKAMDDAPQRPGGAVGLMARWRKPFRHRRYTLPNRAHR